MPQPTFARIQRGNQRKTFHAGAGVELVELYELYETPSRDVPLIVDRIIDPCTIPDFIGFASGGDLPGGRKTTIPLLEDDDILAMTQPYKEWATAPFKDLDTSTMHHIMVSIGSHEEGERLVCVGKDIHAMKIRAWVGLPPLSERRWEEEKLDDWTKFDEAIEYLGLLTDTFSYLNHPLIRENLRGTYNRIWDHLKQFEDARNIVRQAAGKEKISATGLWQDYIRAHHETMANRAHSWVIAKLAPMRERVVREIRAYKPASEDEFDGHQMALADKGHEISSTYLQADISILMPLDGYKGFGETRRVPDLLKTEGKSTIRMSDVRIERQQIYAERIKFLHNSRMFVAAVSDWTIRPKASPESLYQTSSLQYEAQDETRRELRGEPPILTEVDDWIRIIRPSEEYTKQLGFVVIRLWYSHTPEEWERFKQLFEADIHNWGAGVNGSDSVKQKITIHWVDGQDLGIPKMDLATARACFQSYVDGPDFPEGLRKNVFLVADPWSMGSYLTPSESYGGHIRAVDPYFDADDPPSHMDESPGYKGDMRVRGSVLWDDFFALFETQAQNLQDLWPLAMDHPMQTYIGPVTRMQLNDWKEQNMFKSFMMGGFRDFLRQRTEITPEFESLIDDNPMLREN